MGLFGFAKGLGRKLFGNEEEAPEKIQEHIEEDNPGIDHLEVDVVDGVAILKGKAESAEALEKAILMAGNVEGIADVNAEAVEAPEATYEVEYYDIQKGDNLWKIAQKVYEDGSRHPLLFEANREVIKDADLIFPGQRIRIPMDN